MSVLSQRQLAGAVAGVAAGAVAKSLPAPGRCPVDDVTGEPGKHYSRDEARDTDPLGAYGLRLGPIRWRLWLRWIF